FVGAANVGHDILHESWADKLNGHVLFEVLSKHDIRRIEMAEMSGDQRLGACRYRDLAEVKRAGMGPRPDSNLATEINRLLRERAFVNQQVTVLSQLDQTIAWGSIAAKHH